MQIDNELINIEDYEQAYHSRLNDLIRLNTIEKPRKVFSMHLGGVVIECLLKDLIVKKKNITKRRSRNKTQWFTQEVFERFSSQGEVTKSEFQIYSIENPGHEFMAALNLLEDLYSIMPDHIIEKLKKLYNPLQIERHDFVDLRYIAEDSISEEEFKLWYEDFQTVSNWIARHGYLGNSEVY